MITKLVSAALTIVVSLGMTSIATVDMVAAGQDGAAGNNGTLKVHEAGTPSGTESNDPKVCSFNFEGFGFDDLQDGYIEIETQGGSSPIGENAGPFDAGPADEDGNFATMYFNDEDGPVIKNGTYKATLYGKDGPNDEQPDEKAKSKVFKVECEGGRGEVGVPGSVVSLVCPVNSYTLTVANTGTTIVKVTINGVEKEIAIGGQAISADFKVGDVLTVLVDGQPVTVQGKLLNSYKLPVCAGGMGTIRGTTGTVTGGFGAGAATDVTSLPVTSGSNAQLAAIVAMIGSVLATAGVYTARTRDGFSL